MHAVVPMARLLPQCVILESACNYSTLKMSATGDIRLQCFIAACFLFILCS